MDEIKKNKYTEDEKLQAAYVLNMCTVSVAQIVDYNDEYILEQEYEAILNNLNLEQIPKDEALLNILKEVLDTITFFRIYDKKKNMIEKKYQQKIKNAIWNAVPNLGMLIAGGNPITMAISLASNIGIGYMNYRRTMAENELEYEEEIMNLQITAIEQLNALKRELFTTSWRLADEYEFRDEYRLTERQIKQYNEILMDQDPIRRYRRLDAIKESFLAYPAFWYFIGSAANQISRISGDNYTDEFKEEYKKIAIEHFDYYFKMNETSVLREDQLVASCALEYYELLPGSEVNKRKELLEKAIKWSGMRSDIIQICAVDFLRIENYSESEKLFGILIDEGYNADINAQMLSSIYALHYFKEPSQKLLFDYTLLSKQQSFTTLFPLPIEENNGKNEIQLWDDFISRQMIKVQELYNNVFDRYFSAFEVEFNGLLMRFDATIQYPNSFFKNDKKKKREEEAERVFSSEIRRLDYIEELKSRNYSTQVVNILNRMLIGLQELPFLSLDEPVKLLRETMLDLRDLFEAIQENINTESITIDTYRDLFENVAFFNITSELQKMIHIQGMDYLKTIKDMKDIIHAEVVIQKFCDKNSITFTEEDTDDIEDNPMLDPYKLDFSLVGKTALSLDRENQYRNKMLKELRMDLPGIIKTTDKLNVLFLDDDSFDSYFSMIAATSNDKNILRNQALAVLDDKRLIGDIDLVFTFNSIIPIRMKVRGTPAKYKDIQWNTESESLVIGGILYNNPNIQVKKLGILIEKLTEIRAEFDR